MYEISRRQFLVGAAASGAALAMGGLMTSCSSSSSSSEALYTAGTYSASAYGKNGDVTVTLTFDDSSITAVELDLSCETETIGQAAGDELIEQILEAQSAEIDGVGGATLTSTAVAEAAADCIAQATGESTDDTDDAEEETEEEEEE